MHPYAINSQERIKIAFIIAGLSIVSAWLFYDFLNYIGVNYWWLELPSGFTFYLFYYKTFDLFLWKINFLHKIGLIKTPNINGQYSIKGTSSHDNHNEEFEANFIVKQTWTNIVIKLETTSSLSKSEVASFVIDDDNSSILNYQYLNEPKAPSPKTMVIHRGTSRFKIDSNNLLSDGEYYTGRGRNNFGNFTQIKSI